MIQAWRLPNRARCTRVSAVDQHFRQTESRPITVVNRQCKHLFGCSNRLREVRRQRSSFRISTPGQRQRSDEVLLRRRTHERLERRKNGRRTVVIGDCWRTRRRRLGDRRTAARRTVLNTVFGTTPTSTYDRRRRFDERCG